MSLFDNPEYRWRETYLLFHRKSQRALAEKVVQTIAGIRGHYKLEQVVADAEGHFESGTVFAEEAFAAIDLSYVEDDQIREQIAEIQIKGNDGTRITRCGHRFDDQLGGRLGKGSKNATTMEPAGPLQELVPGEITRFEQSGCFL